MEVIAWVESPLQLIGAAEWAAAHRTRVPVAGRLTAQMTDTAEELLARRASFGRMDAYLGIPWKLLASHDQWLVGDGFSGQFRLAASVLRPKRITFLDDGANALAFADTLLDRRGYARPGVDEGRLSTLTAPFALQLIHDRASRGGIRFFTAFTPDAGALAEHGIPVERHAFDWTTRTAPDPALPSGRVLLGSALPTDGRLDTGVYLDWIRSEAAEDALTYFPHRREGSAQRAAVAAIEGVALSEGRLPIELVLAGARTPLDVLTLASSTTTTLPLVLAGTGSVIHEWMPGLGRTQRVLR